MPTTPPQEPLQAALLSEGDRLARQLAQHLNATLQDQTRLIFLSRSLVYNLVQAFQPTVEQITRHAGMPLHTELTLDHRHRPQLSITDRDGVLLPTLPVDDLLNRLLNQKGKLHPAIHTHLQDGLTGDEHHATQTLVRCLRSKPVLDGMQREIQRLMQEARANQ